MSEENQKKLLRVILKKNFGFDNLRPGQDKVIEAVMTGENVLGIMPTGGGKSLCYQLPALCKEGVCLVVSPLIALMKDQVDALVAKGINATMINSSLSYSEQQERVEGLKRGDYKLVYIAPERFANESFMMAIQNLKVSLFAVDEAHCLSQWGHDFRPDYLKLERAIRHLGNPQVIALTATATPRVREDIITHLGLKNPVVIVRGFARENLHFRISHCENHKEKYKRLYQLATRHRTGIIYCSTRKKVEHVYKTLSEMGLRVTAYHAGMTDEQRETAQEDFMTRRADIVIATNAFGMGIDRADVRFVAHFEIPGSVEAYYQEAGRAGRDGLEAYCEILFNHADLRTHEFFIEGSNTSPCFIIDLYEMLRNYCDVTTREVHLSIDEMSRKMHDATTIQINTALMVLMKAKAISRHDVPGMRIKSTRITDPCKSGLKIDIDTQDLREKYKRDLEKLHSIIKYTYSQGCRQQWILNYFGEENSLPCGKCDQCVSHDAHSNTPLADNELLILRQVLSGIARSSVRLSDGTWQGRWGKTKIIQMLRGSKSADIMNSSLCRLSTFGILSQLTEEELYQIFREIQIIGLTKISGDPNRPLLTLSQKGHDVMLNKCPVYMVWPLKKQSALHKKNSHYDPTLPPDVDQELLLKLKEIRLNFAKAENKPAFAIFPNSVLIELARQCPTTLRAAKQIKGISEEKAIKYLYEFIEVIIDHIDP